MIKLFFYSLIFLVITAYIALIAKEDPGYALLSHGDWSIEGTMVLLISVLSTLIGSILLLIYLILKTIRFPGQLSQWNQNRKTVKAIKNCNKDYIQLAEGNWREAEKHLRKSAHSSGMPILNYLAAARAAQEEGSQQRRDDYLLQAHKSDPQADIAIGLTQAELQFKDGQAEQALATLMHLRSIAPKHRQVLKMLFQVYQQLNSWSDLENLLPELRKNNIFEHHILSQYEQSLSKRLMMQAIHNQNHGELKSIWNRLPKVTRTEPELIQFYCQLLLSIGEQQQAIDLIREGIKRHWYTPLILLYGQAEEKDIAKQLETAESWLSDNGRSAELLLTLGRLSIKNQLWGKARDYISESISVTASTEAYQVLGELYENQLDNSIEAMNCYREGLLLSTQRESLRTHEELPLMLN
ncbi:MAG: heme biosynthesis protein HemY [gamma proteobacterium symbiont of Bathyaustriella thionipta]|nr:heme biosynthesis protein HemY [gamma proteobacterium symbiont of Bathyaustriella thionipta]MCU7949963.1 heme biosynthesis protein HemY [gamma proteobacterium symbiont of Bathyaustriella thionipta]MCU7953618.1 heme biosynthesis protein HemY [gamma proteobacterium symbiont of Bathyaustriella thionipta]MCU7956533.1 heme biosynthesis protein HemY [gamma proteobacterium symbiont of Bathyaustriella thionipta]MCU7968796.1 heme biosynthesis protein HemY [gamma proteobacterium symbiont of Bathyaustr